MTKLIFGAGYFLVMEKGNGNKFMKLNILTGTVLRRKHLGHYIMSNSFLSKIFMQTITDTRCPSTELATSILTNADPKPTEVSITSNQVQRKTYDLKIIIPVYNNEGQIERCLNSVISQKSKYKIKIAIVDDGSNDSSLKIIKGYEGNDIDVFTQISNGASSARNLALKTIDRKYIMFLDADDTLQGNAVDILLNKALKYNADVVEGSFKRIKRTREYSGVVHTDDSNAQISELYGYPWGKVFRSELFENLKFPVGYWFEDAVISFLIFSQVKKAVTISSVVYNYDYNSMGLTAASKHKNLKCIDTYWITELMLEEIKRLGIRLDDQLLDIFLNEVISNFRRTRNMDEVIKKAIFVKTVDLMKKRFTNQIPGEKLKGIYHALKGNNYKEYYMICILL